MKHFVDRSIMHYDMMAARIPVSYLHWLTLTVIVALQIQHAMTYTEALLLVGSGVLFIALHWYCQSVMQRSKLLYFALQGVLCSICTLMANDYAILVLLSFGSILMIQAFYELKTRMQYATFVCCYFIVSAWLLKRMYMSEYLVALLLIMILTFILVYLVLSVFHRKEREKQELQLANKKIEQLTRQNERQRMARDLHDSLIQRLIGANLKLDVVEAHLKKGNYDKAEAVTILAKTQVSESIQEARKVVDDLRRSLHHLPFEERLMEEVQQLAFTYSLPVTTHIDVQHDIAQHIGEQIIAIVKEALTNVYKHANATNVYVHVVESNSRCDVVIRDNGVGLCTSPETIGHYGIIGMKERATILGGTLHVTSKQGVTVRVVFPLLEVNE